MIVKQPENVATMARCLVT